MNIKVDDDFCDESLFKEMKECLSHTHFPWYWHLNKTTDPNDGLYQFVHMFYEENQPISNWFPLVNKVLDNQNPVYLRIKANLQPDILRGAQSGFHHDMGLYKGHTTSILYMNTNNGFTIFEGGPKIESVENRLITFPSELRHAAIESTDLPRIVVNFNYYG
tara:strand:+ start:1553 stop:2038 length:486 start_codon:yes stop_codon:yes gene_type:complete